MRLVLKGTQRYWFHAGLVSLVGERTGWDETKVKKFLSSNELVFFNRIERVSAMTLLDALERMGFEVQLQETRDGLTASVAMPYEKELELLRQEIGALSSRIKTLEESKGITAPVPSVKASEVYQKLASVSAGAEPADQESRFVRMKQVSSKGTTENAIGKYWLSRIGIFTLVLGIVLFISYSFQPLGPWGKILIGLAVGVALVGAGNYLAPRENYRRWAMAMIGGGWAVIYFTVYAAYYLPVAKIIENPFVAFVCLILVVVGSVSQSLRYQSGVLTFFSYFLGFVAITMVQVSFYSLFASFLLAFSLVIVMRKTGWNWLALLGILAVYIAHFVWLAPAFHMGASAYAGQETLSDALILPWIRETWKLYPLMGAEKSSLHMGFLVLYWMLFTTIGFFKKNEGKASENEIGALLALNSFIFVTSFVHHLHVYYPQWKYVFPLVMGAVFLALFAVEEKMQRRLISDLYLALSVTLFALAIPMYFEGPLITYGWAAGCFILTALGIRHERTILRRLSWVLALIVVWRLSHFDYLEKDVLLSLLMPVENTLLIFAVAGLAFAAIAWMYEVSALTNEKEKRIAGNAFVITSAFVFGLGFMMGGFRQASSVVWTLEGLLLMFLWMRFRRLSIRIAAIIVLGLAAFRLITVDFQFELVRIFLERNVAFRMAAVAASVLSFLVLSDVLRREVKPGSPDYLVFPYVSALGGLLLLLFFYDKDISSWISLIWGAFAFTFVITGFSSKEKVYRVSGLVMFALVLIRLFLHDFSKLETLYRIISFTGLGIVFITASFLYSYYSKRFLEPGSKR
ncbi:MAG: DUF2339 domain-containing protein [Candidatus Omnitrophica bacterium]|nr:DUF2339 domain-containing protein [Candidatus Omnitrophota bacterium]MDD5670129.1 DUF2339 domain-containing protein [Candidatus Omnitrophota bacterium]